MKRLERKTTLVLRLFPKWNARAIRAGAPLAHLHWYLMRETVSPARAIEGVITLPGDKSISHRYGMLAAVASGRSTIANYSTGADCQSTLACMAALGAKIERQSGSVVIDGMGEGGALQEPAGMLDAGNSGSTIRMLSGILAAQPFTSRIGGDESLSRRPMARIIAPLTEMGGFIEARDTKFPPLTIHGRALHGIDYTPPMASAQVKSCVLLAGLFAKGDTIVREPVRTRDHTEIALKEFGAEIEIEKRTIHLRRWGASHWSGARRARRSLLRLLLPGRRAAAQGIEPGDPRRRPEPDRFGTARFSGLDGFADQGARGPSGGGRAYRRPSGAGLRR